MPNQHTHRRTATTIATALIAAGLAATPTGVASAAPAGGWGGPGDYTDPGGCTTGDASSFDVEFDAGGELGISFADDGVVTCDENVQIQTWASNGIDVDVHSAPALDELQFTMSALEAAGPSGLTGTLDVDPCFTAITVLRDGDTLVFDDIVGDGCDLVVNTDFVGGGHASQIHVVQQTGVIAPPHVYDVAGDDTTVLTGLPDGTWYVKVFDGWTAGSTIEVDGAGAQAASTIYDVADGSTVDITIAAPLKVVAPVIRHRSSEKFAIIR